ncbi:MAG: ABC transporter substrate-binding protein [Desulfobacteraceae bacterium]|jgi:branched-chain amino acid transport system substrate-binding protein|nr:ABC transporter substrate-binding protein [Desulfobacteraceae bacterium]
MFNRQMGRVFGLSLLIAAMLMVGIGPLAVATAAEPIKIGQVSALSGQSAKSGEAIMRGLTLAIEEINANGGVLGGRMFTLISRDDESNPPKGQMAARELIFKEKVTAFFGGLDSPVSLAIVPVANKEKVIFMGVWAAATPITRNGADPNYVFRVSAMDAIVDQALIQYAMKTHGAKKPGLMLINNPWGESNEKGLRAAITDAKIDLAGIEKLESRDVDVVPQLMRLKQAGADTIILVANVQPSSTVVKSLARMNWDVPVVSHWGVSGGRFPELAGPGSQKVHFVQTYSFFGEQNEVGKKFIAAAIKKYSDIKGPEDIFPPVGYANAYDAMHLLALAIEQAGSTDGDKIRLALENLKPHQGLIKKYNPAFTPENHDALGYQDYVMVQYVGNEIKPVGK